MLVLIIFFGIFTLLLGIIVHELGHLVFGLVSGYSFSVFRVGPLCWFKEEGRMRFRVSKSPVVGQCLMTPNPIFENFKFVLYNAGGGIFNVLFALVFVPILFFELNTFVLIWVVNSFVLGVLNLVPSGRAIPNDGRNIIKALESKAAARGLYNMLYSNGRFVQGATYSDFDENFFDMPEEANVNNYLVATSVLSKAGQLDWLGRYDEAAREFERLPKEVLDKLPTFYKVGAKLALIDFYVMRKKDFQAAIDLAQDAYVKKVLKASSSYNPSYLCVSAGYAFFVEKDRERALKLLDGVDFKSLPKGVGVMAEREVAGLVRELNRNKNSIQI